MNAVFNPCSMAESEVPEVLTPLTRWYAVHSSIRRLWVLEDSTALIVCVALEPTSDGDDPLPIWLANHDEWLNDLRRTTQREVELKLIISGALAEHYVNADAVEIAELRWRDSWESP